MAKMTVLEMVQDILNDMDSDEVNSINDTIEAQQVANTVRTVYANLVAERKWPTTRELIQLTGLADVNKPNYMRLSDNISEIDWVKYDKQKDGATKTSFSEVIYLDPSEFITETNGRDSSATTIDIVSDYSGVPLYIRNDISATYWTSFDDEYIVFDSYDSVVESTMQTSKSQVYGIVEPSFTISDTFVPDMPAKAFPMLLSESKSYCFVNLKQQPNAKVEETNRRQRTVMAREKWRVNGGIKYDNYGRK